MSCKHPEICDRCKREESETIEQLRAELARVTAEAIDYQAQLGLMRAERDEYQETLTAIVAIDGACDKPSAGCCCAGDMARMARASLANRSGQVTTREGE